MQKPKVAFVCVHNSCRSQIAEALGKAKYADVFESFSAGTEIVPNINEDAVRLVKALYGIDMEKAQRSKLIGELPRIDILVTMGCNVHCPFVPCRHREDWGLDDPTGRGDAAFLETIEAIEQKLGALAQRIRTGDLQFSKAVKKALFVRTASNEAPGRIFILHI